MFLNPGVEIVECSHGLSPYYAILPRIRSVSFFIFSIFQFLLFFFLGPKNLLCY
jgi:hypothetical protein